MAALAGCAFGVTALLLAAPPALAGCNSGNAGNSTLLNDAACEASASGDFATAVGTGASANLDHTTAYGDHAVVSGGDGSTAIGANTSVSGADGTAVGLSANAVDGSTAIGAFTKATEGALALGESSQATGSVATAVGSSTSASESFSVAVGFQAAASAPSSVVLGPGAKATRFSSVAIGADSVANVSGTVSVGHKNHGRRIVNVADGVDNTDAATVGQMKALISAVRVAAPATEANLGADAGAIVVPVAVTGRTSASAATTHRGAHGGGATVPIVARDTAESNGEDLEPSAVVGWAKVLADGSIAGARNIIGNIRRGIGRYEIAFKHASLAQCVYNATLHGAGLISVNEGSLSNSLSVETRNHLGVLTDFAFHLVATC